MQRSDMASEPIAIIGRGCVLPGALSPDDLWRAVEQGRDLTSDAPAGAWGLDPARVIAAPDARGLADKTFGQRGGYVAGFDAAFDPDSLAVPALELARLDAGLLWLLYAGRAAWREGAGPLGHAQPARVGVVVANLSYPTRGFADFASAVWRGDAKGGPAPINRFSSGYPAHLLAKALGLGGRAFALDAACASSLYALKHACDALADGEADAMLVGALNACDNLFLHMGFTALSALSRTGRSRPFSKSADGLLPAEGAAAVTLVRARDVDPARDTVYGVIRGVGVSNDGKRRGLLAPDADGQREALVRAYAAAGVDPRSVSLVECHATGTPTGDPLEARGLAAFFEGVDDLPVGSLKSNTGHLITAAGLGGLLKLLGALAHETRPPTAGLDDPIDAFQGTPVRPLTRPEPWPAGDAPRRAGLSAFGFGGCNAHLVLEEWRAPTTPPPAAKPRATAPVVICGAGASAGSAIGLAAILDALARPAPDAPAARRGAIGIDLARTKTPPADLKKTLGQQTILFEVVDEALDGVRQPAPDRVGVVVAMGCDAEAARWALRWRDATTPEARDGVVGVLEAAHVLGAMPNVPANRLNVRGDWRGLGLTVSSEELSPFAALRLAARAVAAGEIDMAVVAAADLSCEPVHAAALSAARGDAAPVPGDAAAALVLKRCADAESDGDAILATLDEAQAPEPHSEAIEALRARFGDSHAASALVEIAVGAAAAARRVALDAEGARAWLATAHAVDVARRSFSGRSDGARLIADRPRPAAAPNAVVPHLAWFAAADAADLAERAARDARGGEGPARLAVVARSPTELGERLKDAASRLRAGEAPQGPGVHAALAPIEGETALMFTGAAAAYPTMARDLFAAFPEALDTLATRFGEADDTARRLFRDPDMLADPFEQLRATTLVSQLHALVARDALGIAATAALGLSSGETNALLAFGAWNDPDALLADVRASGMYDRWLCGRFETANAAWDLKPDARVSWKNWRVLAPVDAVRAAVATLTRVSVTIVHGPRDCVIAGEAEACRRVIEAVGAGGAVELGQDMIVHCAEMEPFAETWRAIHTRPTRKVAGVRFYANATNVAYAPTRAAAADMLTRQAVAPIDFPATVEQAYADGVRLFVEAGPRDVLAGAVGDVLNGRPHVAVALDRFGRPPLVQIADATATLWAAGAPVKIASLAVRCDLLRASAAGPAPMEKPFTVPAHPPPVVWNRADENDAPGAEALPPAPPLADAPWADLAPRAAAPAAGVMVMERPPDTDAHQTTTAETASLEPVAVAEAPQPPIAPVPVPASVGAERALGVERAPVGPAFDRAQLEAASHGKISDLFGPAFARQDGFARQVRMPMPPLLLADRVTGIEGEPGVLGAGTIWTETDVSAHAWQMHAGHMRPGIVIESGQADLLLASWMGADFLNRGERVYRLLGCELTFHEGGMPAAGDALRFQIDIERHAALGETRLFFFGYDGRIGERTLLSVRSGQAGFFTDAELAQSGGVLWDAATTKPPTAAPRLAPLPSASDKRVFTARDLDAFHAGDAAACFGPGFARANAHQRTPAPPGGRMRMIDAVEAFEPTGGPWKRGYLRAAAAAPQDAWFYEGHFHNDPCMPGTLMAEAAVQAVELFMVAAGLTLERDGWRFEPMPGEAYTFVCRGQVVPDRDHQLTYEIFVDEIVDGPEPVVYAALLARSDGFKVFHCPRFGVRLKKDWPIYARAEGAMVNAAPRIISPPDASWADVRGDYGALLACAWGKPSDAFGSMYARFDRESSVPRLPGPPYHVVSRILSVSCAPAAPVEGATVVAEYDPTGDAWHFDDNGSAIMPFSVLMEVLLQPCGWLASYCGFALEGGLAFRNLDGENAVVHREVRPGDGPLRVTSTLTRFPKVGPMTLVFFDVACACDDEPVMTLATSFGFFPAAALAAQAGLPTTDEQRALLTAPADRAQLAGPSLDPPAAATEPHAPLPPRGDLKMFDAVTGFWPDGGEAGLGRIRARQRIDPGAWYFKAHFYEDPVQPGSLGVEALLQLLEHALLRKGVWRAFADLRFQTPRFVAPARGVPMTWKYRGQVAPTNGEVVTTLDITALTRSSHGVLATAKASLWVDGLRIYEVGGLSVEIVEGPPSKTNTRAFDRARTPWVVDHCPSYARPALPMSALLEAAAASAIAAANLTLPFVIERFAARRWALLEDDALTLDVRTPERGDGRVDLHVRAVRGDAVEALAVGRMRGGGPIPALDPWPDLGAVRPVEVYRDGGLFHGPAFQIARNVRRGAGGATHAIDAARAFVPGAPFDVALIDALLHGIPHDAPELWFGAPAAGRVAYPAEIEHFVMRHAGPRADETIEVAARPLALARDGRSLRVAVRATTEAGVWIDLVLREALLPKGPLGRLSAHDRRRFLADGAPVPGAGLSQARDGATVLALADVAASDWLPGTLARVYDVDARLPELARVIAVKEHAARAWGVHPRAVTVDGAAARSDDRVMTVAAAFDRAARGWRVTDDG